MSNTSSPTHYIRLTVMTTLISMMAFFDYALVFYFKELIVQNFFGGRHLAWLSFIQTVGLFLGAYIANPVGGFLLGQYGDLYGRKAVMFLSLLGLTVFTLIIAFLPVYTDIGVVAPILFLMARFGQGLAFGGQIPSVLVLVTEQLPKRHVGFGCGIVVAGILVSVLSLKMLTAFFENYLSHAVMLDYGWRIPFLLGGVLSAGLLILFKFFQRLPISAHSYAQEEYTQHSVNLNGLTSRQIQDLAENNIFYDNNVKPPISQIINKNHLASIVLAVATSWIMLSIFVVIAMILPDLLEAGFVVSESILIFGSGISIFFMIIGSLFYGYLVDRINAGKVMIVGGVLLIFQTSLFFVKLKFGSNLMLLWFALLGFSGGLIAALPTILIRLFPSRIRLTSIALTHSTTYVLVSGGLPAMLGFATFYFPLAPALYLLWVGLMAIFLSFYIYYIPKNHDQDEK